jgi:hypothetical protein
LIHHYKRQEEGGRKEEGSGRVVRSRPEAKEVIWGRPAVGGRREEGGRYQQ